MYGMRHGEGVLRFANRASYSGHWELDKVIHPFPSPSKTFGAYCMWGGGGGAFYESRR